MPDSVMSLRDVVIGILGGVIALAGQAVHKRHASTKSARVLAAAYWEELSAVHFVQDGSYRGFAGFSCQVFDSMFKDTAENLPDSLARDIMRYHWRMKYLDHDQRHNELGHPSNQVFVAEAEEWRARLLKRLDHYSRRASGELFFERAETCGDSF